MAESDTAETIVASSAIEKKRRISAIMRQNTERAGIGMVAVVTPEAPLRFQAVTAIKAILAA